MMVGHALRHNRPRNRLRCPVRTFPHSPAATPRRTPNQRRGVVLRGQLPEPQSLRPGEGRAIVADLRSQQGGDGLGAVSVAAKATQSLRKRM